MIRIINVSADTLLLRCWYTYATEQWYSTDTVLSVYHSLTIDTLPIRYRYAIDTLLIRISDTEIYTVSAYHTSWCTRTTMARSRARARFTARSEDHCAHERMGWWVWPGCEVLCMHACQKQLSTWSSSSDTARTRLETRIDAYCECITRAYFRRGEWPTVMIQYHCRITYVSLKVEECISRTANESIEIQYHMRIITMNTVSLVYHKHTRWYVHDTAWYIRDTCQFELIHSGSWYILNTVANTSWYTVIQSDNKPPQIW